MGETTVSQGSKKCCKMISFLSLESSVLFISENAIAEQVHTGNETSAKVDVR